MARFFDEDAFDEGFEPALAEAAELEARVCAASPAFARHTFDVSFVSDDPKKLTAFAKFLTGISYRMAAPTRADDGRFTCRGQSMPLPVAEDTVIHWAVDLYGRAYEYDCALASHDLAPAAPLVDTRSAAQLFAEALASFERDNRGLAIALFTQALAIEPDNPNTWYSRGCVKDQLEMSAGARADYDKALALAPRFIAALVNRGANKDNDGEYDAAIEDYDRALAINAKTEAAFLNRGNSKLNKGDKPGAIADWKVAAGLGSASAKKRLTDHR